MALLKKELHLELRSKAMLGGILLYVVSSIFIVYFSTRNISKQSWNSLFWIIGIFAAVSVVAKSFFQEPKSRQLYYYQLVQPLEFIIAKVIYNFLFILMVLLLTTLIFGVVGEINIARPYVFGVALLLGSLSFAIVFSFVSALAMKTKNQGTISTIMSFPLSIGLMMLIVRLSGYAIGILHDTSYDSDILFLICINTILIALILILYPFVWKD